MEAVCRQTLYLYAKLAAEIYSSLQVYPVDSLCKLEVSKLCDLLECASELRVHSVYALRSDRDRYELVQSKVLSGVPTQVHYQYTHSLLSILSTTRDRYIFSSLHIRTSSTNIEPIYYIKHIVIYLYKYHNNLSP